jgi:hypothetical protein
MRPPIQPVRESITAAEARATMYTGIDNLYESILLAAYMQIRSSAICGSTSISDDFAGCDPDDPAAVVRAMKRVAALLRKQGFSCTVIKTAIDIEWGE